MRATLTVLTVLSLATSAAAQTADPKSDWSRIVHLRAGTEIGVRPENSRTRTVTVVAADDRELIVLHDLADSVPVVARRYIKELYRNAPEFFVSPGDRSFEDPKRGVRLSAAGVIAGGRKVADWSSVVERLPRDQVVEITGKDSVWNGALIGMAVPMTSVALLCIPSHCNADIIPPLVGTALSWGLLGLIIDAAGGEAVVYARPDPRSARIRFAPIVGRGQKGALVTVGF